MSALPTRPMPPPRQKPCTAAITGTGAVVDRGERGEAAPVGADQGVEALGGLHLLDVDAGVEAAALGPQDDDPHRGVLARARATMSASSNQPATVSALTGGLSMTTSAMPLVVDRAVRCPWRACRFLMGRQIGCQTSRHGRIRGLRPLPSDDRLDLVGHES